MERRGGFVDASGGERMLDRAALYQHWFNYGRWNSYYNKGGRTPWQILHEDCPDLGRSISRPCSPRRFSSTISMPAPVAHRAMMYLSPPAADP